MDHAVLLSILREKLHDNRFLRLIESLLQAGYLEDWRYHATLSGSPQGAVLSPILSNIYLDQLDKFVETTLLPAYNVGDRRRPNPPWARLQRAGDKPGKAGHRDQARLLRRQMQQVPPWTRSTPTIVASATCDMPTIGCSVLAGHDTKPRRSSMR